MCAPVEKSDVLKAGQRLGQYPSSLPRGVPINYAHVPAKHLLGSSPTNGVAKYPSPHVYREEFKDAA